jgi:Ca-activated chloride channel family protein
MGSEGGAKIPVETDQGEAFLRDRSGREVVSALHAGALRQIAAATGGTYADGAAPEALVATYEQEILPRARRSFEDRAIRTRPNRFQWPLLIGIGLWLLDLAWTRRRRP